MAETKTSTLTVRVSPSVKQVLRNAAENEHRSLANMLEIMIRDYCKRNKVPASKPSERESA